MSKVAHSGVFTDGGFQGLWTSLEEKNRYIFLQYSLVISLEILCTLATASNLGLNVMCDKGNIYTSVVLCTPIFKIQTISHRKTDNWYTRLLVLYEFASSVLRIWKHSSHRTVVKSKFRKSPCSVRLFLFLFLSQSTVSLVSRKPLAYILNRYSSRSEVLPNKFNGSSIDGRRLYFQKRRNPFYSNVSRKPNRNYRKDEKSHRTSRCKDDHSTARVRKSTWSPHRFYRLH